MTRDEALILIEMTEDRINALKDKLNKNKETIEKLERENKTIINQGRYFRKLYNEFIVELNNINAKDGENIKR